MNDLTDTVRAQADPLPVQTEILAGAVLRPPRLSWDGTRYRGARLRSADMDSVSGLPGVVQVVVERDFVGIVAQTAAFAQGAVARLHVAWDEVATQSHTPRPNSDDTEDAEIARTYRWPADGGQATVGTWAVAWHHGDGVTVWTACDAPDALRAELASLLALPLARVEVRGNGMPASALAFDAAADAALLSKAVGKPVQVQAHPQAGSASGGGLMMVQVQAARDTEGHIARFELGSDGGPAVRPSVARLLSQGRAAQPDAGGLVSYAFAEQSITRSEAVSLGSRQGDEGGLAGEVFATESFMDEAACLAGAAPVDFRLAHIEDARGAALVRTVYERAQGAPRNDADGRGTRRGTGFAYASTATEGDRTWSAWVVDLSVDAAGHVDVDRVVVGHDAEQLRPMTPGAVSIEAQVQDAAARLLRAPSFDDWEVSTPAKRSAAVAQVPSVDVVGPANALAPAGSLSWGRIGALPAAPALANAIFDATGVRLREPPFSGPEVQARLGDDVQRGRLRNRRVAWLAGLAAAAAGLLATVVPWRAAIAPSAPPEPGLYSPAAIERGRLVAAAGDCVVCHTAPGGRANAGGLALATPFGTIWSTNITPDAKTGIGGWSYAAFERAMREGIHRDGRRLYPAFPYTAFAKVSDGDLQALYAYLMTQPTVESKPPETRLAFPFGMRGLLGGWNLLFHDDKPYRPDPARSPEWNRGAYLVQGLGHCGACHTPRNAFGAEKSGPKAFLAGGLAEGWEAPALTGLSKSPLPWTNADLYEYLRTGVSARHGVAAGPMAPVVHELRQLPDSDIRAMTTYLMALNPPAPQENRMRADLQALESRAADAQRLDGPGARIFEGACAVCHQTPGGPTLFGSKVSLALNTNLHSGKPDNLVQVILHGIADPAHESLGYMPGFADSLDDEQVSQLVHYLRGRFGDGKPAWTDVPGTVARLRDTHVHAPRP